MRKDLATVNKSLAAAHKAAAAAAAAAPAPGGAATAQTLSSSADASHSAAATTDIKAAIVAKEEALEARTAQLRLALNAIGNLVHDSVPVASDEAHNAVLRTWATDKRLINPALAVSSGGTSHATLASSSSPSSSSSSSQASAVGGGGGGAVAPFELLHHHQLLYMIDGYDAERGARVAGHRGYYLKNAGVLLNQALLNYGLAFLLGKQFTAIQPPFFLNEEVMAETAQLSDFDESLYKISGGAPGEQAKYLIATSEQPLSALHRGEWLQPKELPLKYAGISTCFRKEAGSYGRDAWGVFRVHQFEKVEQFVLASPAQSWQLMEEMMAASEQFYQSLALPYRVINIVSGALNSAAAKKYDLEAWFPTLGAYRELVSCSNCTDYQARALGTRFGFKKAGDREKAYVHMLNGTLCATERTMCCVLENYQEANGVRVPPPLVPYMGGTTFLPFVKEVRRACVCLAC